jgi:bisphosphoglycerate-independent phosphoglycerate mutase (AlkP superfamily)
MSDETLETAARRVVRFVRSDEHAHGGLLSKDTIQAVETLDRQLQRHLARQKLAAAALRQEDRTWEPGL